MKVYLISLGVGVMVGVIYALLNVRSPAPPVVALVGLLGILIGEQIPPLFKQVWRGEPMVFSWASRTSPQQVEPASGATADKIHPGDGDSA
jgi:XapX domain-containing protein